MQMKHRARRVLAAGMSAVLLTGTMVFPAMADETAPKNQWILNDEGYWNYYKSSGEMASGEVRKIHGAWYAFDEDGRMYSDEIFDSIEGEPDENGELLQYYAFPDGELASDQWVKLNDGRLYDGGNEFDWYYFDSTSESPGVMVKNRELTVADGSTVFDDKGHMYAGTWVSVDSEGTIEAVKEGSQGSQKHMRYYEPDGFRAEDKKLPLGEFWYTFDESGVVRNIVRIASSSNADPSIQGMVPATPSNAVKLPASRIESIAPSDTDPVEFVPGQELKLEFEVTLVDEKYPVNHEGLTNDHQMWVDETLVNGKIHIRIKDKAKGICEVTYTPKLQRKEQLVLHIDEEEAAYNLVPKAQETLTAQERESTVTAALKSMGELSPTTIIDAVSSNYQAADAAQKQQLQKTLQASSEYEQLSETYKMMRGIAETVAVSEEAGALLNGDVKLVGGALNADKQGSQVTLQVTEAGEAPDLADLGAEGTFGSQLAFDITLSVNDENQAELAMPVKIVMPVPAGYDVDSVSLYHIHDGEVSEVEITRGADNTVTFMTDRFSTFIFAQNGTGGQTGTTDSGSSSSSDDSGSYTPDEPEGQWILDGTGWWYRDSDGSYPANTWRYVSYQGRMDWYHFNADGYITTGWFTDTDGHIYYLNPVSNGFMGAMVTGWQQIDGIWYYFHTEADGHRGMLYVNTTTPDGYLVDEKGQWIP